jgi:hypothetical protein
VLAENKIIEIATSGFWFFAFDGEVRLSTRFKGRASVVKDTGFAERIFRRALKGAEFHQRLIKLAGVRMGDKPIGFVEKKPVCCRLSDIEGDAEYSCEHTVDISINNGHRFMERVTTRIAQRRRFRARV